MRQSTLKKFFIIREMELSLKISFILGNRNTKKFLIFSQKEAILIFRETKTPKKNSYIF